MDLKNNTTKWRSERDKVTEGENVASKEGTAGRKAVETGGQEVGTQGWG